MANQHVNPGYEDRIAIAPYNFVPLAPKAITDEPLCDPDATVVKSPLSHDRYWLTDESGAEVLTGYFNCSLTAETLLYIRGLITQKDQSAGKDTKSQPDFFSTDGGKTPCIPGSSLRGLFRSLIEIASFSKMSGVSDRKPVFRAVDTSSLGIEYRGRVMEEVAKNTFVPRVRAGYVRKADGAWWIQPAEEIGGTSWCRISHRALDRVTGALQEWPPPDIVPQKERDRNDPPRCYNAKTIYVQPGPFQLQEVRGGFLSIKFARALQASPAPNEKAGLRLAALVISGKMLSKRSEAVIFQPDPNRNSPEKGWIPLRDEVIVDGELRQVELDLDYLDQVSDQQAVLLGNPDKAGKKQDRNGALRDYQPVFYLVEQGRLTFFGHTQMLRLPYEKSPRDLTPRALRDESAIDLAQAMFGYVDRKPRNPEDKPAMAGRVFFSDARYSGNLSDPFEPVLTPKVLSTPKPTTFQHYLEQPVPDDVTQLKDFNNQTRIRGHKLYWHHNKVDVKDVEERDSTKTTRHASQYTKIQPVKAGAQFDFTIHFENLRREELGALAWVLQIASDVRYRLKLGMGKPYGMGAVKIVSSLTLTNRQDRYGTLLSNPGAWYGGELDPDETMRKQVDTLGFFEQWVLRDQEINPGHVNSLADLPRIRELLILLAWPGPDRRFTRYMEIEHPDPAARGGKRNEYRNRPVLPLPSAVGKRAPKGARAPEPPRRREDEEDDMRSREQLTRPPITNLHEQPARTPPQMDIPEVRQEVSDAAKTAAAKLEARTISEGEIVEATVVRVTANEYQCRLGEGVKMPGKLPRDEKVGLKVGDKIKVKVRRIAGSGAAILTVRGIRA
ncbi:MAG: TIGR03986 family CRISPR-associated RAMP protein [Chloroflexi bacterium]|nr:TIGR03986 family CRISPR-associated RAMP protein [Chloroflexota bacterium]